MKTKGKKITSYDYLVKQKSVWVEPWNRTSPVAFIIGMQFRIVKRMMDNGWFYQAKDKK